MRLIIALVFINRLLASCVSDGKVESQAFDQLNEVISAENSHSFLAPPGISNCAEKPPECQSAKRDFTLCIVDSYDGEPLNIDQVIRSWGASACHARNAAVKQLCGRGLDIMKIEGLQCIPDPSQGECQLNATKCNVRVEKTRCTAKGYAGFGWAEDQVLFGEGDSECFARAELRKIACNQHLQPSQLRNIQCEPTPVFKHTTH